MRIVLLRSDAAHHKYLEAALSNTGMLHASIVEPGRAQRQRLLRTGRFRAWGWRVYQDFRQRVTGRARYARRYFRISSGASLVLRYTVEWVNSPVTHALLVTLKPDLVIVCGTSYIDETLLCTVPIAINVHGGYLPEYRGNHGIFFAYARGDFDRIGASLHLVTPKLDGGDVLAVIQPATRPHEHDGHIYCHAIRDAIGVLCVLLAALAHGRPVHHAPQPYAGETFRHRDRTPIRELMAWWWRKTGRLVTPVRSASIRFAFPQHALRLPLVDLDDSHGPVTCGQSLPADNTLDVDAEDAGGNTGDEMEQRGGV